MSPDRRIVLRAYAVGEISRSLVRQRLGMTWYGELKDAMAQAGISVVDLAREARQIALAIKQLSDKVQSFAARKMKATRS